MNTERSLKTNASITHTKKKSHKKPTAKFPCPIGLSQTNTHKLQKFAMPEMPGICSHGGRRIVEPNYQSLSQLWMATTISGLDYSGNGRSANVSIAHIPIRV